MDDEAYVKTYGNNDLSEGTAERPLVTFAVFAYNQEEFIREAVEGAFSQTYSPLEIILSDDCSTDRTFEIMEEMAKNYRGPHLVKVRRGQRNFGTLGHVLIVSRRSHGKLIVVAAGDDVSTSDRTALLWDEFQKQNATAIYSKVKGMSSGEVSKGQLLFSCVFTGQIRTYGLGASAAYETKFLNDIPLPSHAALHEDVFLASVIYLSELKLIWLDRPLVLYRDRETAQAHKGIKGNYDLTIDHLRKRARRIDYFINLLQYCKSNVEALMNLRGSVQSTHVRKANAFLDTKLRHYEALQIFYKRGIIGGWSRVNQIERSGRPEMIRTFLGIRLYAFAKCLYLMIAP